MILPLLAALFALAGLYLLWRAARARKAAGLPGGRVIYADTRGWGPVEKPLFDPLLNLTGKPDYLVEQAGAIIPVEVKTGHIPDAPRDTHIFQLAAYCLLVERSLGKRPPYGLLHYSAADPEPHTIPGHTPAPDRRYGEGRRGQGRTFAIDYTPELETALLDLLQEMRQNERRPEVDRSHEERSRCAHCGYRGRCDQRLA